MAKTKLTPEDQRLHDSLSEEIHDVYTRLLSDRPDGRLAKPWVVFEVAQQHSRVNGKDSKLALFLMKTEISNRVNSYIRGIKKQENVCDAIGNRVKFRPYCKLQEAYVVNNEIVIVDKMTAKELLEKIDSFTATSRGHILHRNELTRFAKAKFGNEQWAELVKELRDKADKAANVDEE